MRLVILGGGGFRVPLVHASLLADPDRLVDEIVLQDVLVDRLRAIGAVLDQQAKGAAWRPRIRMARAWRTRCRARTWCSPPSA
jgi:6-phospho-beta-glucosidase